MASALAHRGPDAAGDFAEPGVAFAFRRLAILDLSPAGNQPMSDPSGRYRLMHNGEIYNYRELRAELEGKGHRFHTGTDTEVILAAYTEWGESCLRRFNGMWAFAIWDSETRSLFASRDRFGVKPFYYHRDGTRLLFASEPKALLAGGVNRIANPRVIRDYVQQGYLDHTAETFFEGIVRLAPAHSLTFDADGLRLSRYWSLEPRDSPEGDAAEAVREMLFDAVRLRLRSDVPVGTCLSGGLDSSAIVRIVDRLLRTEAHNARQVGDRQQTFTAFFEDRSVNERPFAEAAIADTRTKPHWVTFDADGLVGNVLSIVEAQDEPFGSTSMIAQWYVMREAKRAGLTVMLDGQGADEIFAGYHGYFAPFFADLLAAGRFGALRQELMAYRRLHGASHAHLANLVVRRFMPERIRWIARGRAQGGSSLVHPNLPGGYTPEPEDLSGSDRLTRMLRLLLTTRGLPELLRYEDRNSMAHSLEARVPFLDYRLVELMFSLRAGALIERGMTKAVLRRALSDVLPPLIRDRVDKLGFVTPEARFMRGTLGELAADVFASTSFRERGWVNADAAIKRLGRHRAGELDAGFELWRALNLELWARRFLDVAW